MISVARSSVTTDGTRSYEAPSLSSAVLVCPPRAAGSSLMVATLDTVRAQGHGGMTLRPGDAFGTGNAPPYAPEEIRPLLSLRAIAAIRSLFVWPPAAFLASIYGIPRRSAIAMRFSSLSTPLGVCIQR